MPSWVTRTAKQSRSPIGIPQLADTANEVVRSPRDCVQEGMDGSDF